MPAGVSSTEGAKTPYTVIVKFRLPLSTHASMRMMSPLESAMSDGSSTPATCPMAMPPYPVIVHTTANATSHRTRDVGMTEGGLSWRPVHHRTFDTRDASTDNFLHMIVLLQKS